MLYINLISIFSVLIFGLAFVIMRNSYINRTNKTPKLTNQMIVCLVFGIAVIVSQKPSYRRSIPTVHGQGKYR